MIFSVSFGAPGTWLGIGNLLSIVKSMYKCTKYKCLL